MLSSTRLVTGAVFLLLLSLRPVGAHPRHQGLRRLPRESPDRAPARDGEDAKASAAAFDDYSETGAYEYDYNNYDYYEEEDPDYYEDKEQEWAFPWAGPVYPVEGPLKDECLDGPCLQGGRCVDLPQGFICDCPPQFIGQRCEMELDPCQPNPCRNGGKCYEADGTGACECLHGFEGYFCEREDFSNRHILFSQTEACRATICKNRGECRLGLWGGTWVCDCDTGFYGRFCEYSVKSNPSPTRDRCRSVECQNGGSCVDAAGQQPFCKCVSGYEGQVCEKVVQVAIDVAAAF